jgi:transcription elongation factor Elf1
LVKGKFGIKWSRRRRRRRKEGRKEGERWGTMFRCMQAVARKVAVDIYAKSSSVAWLSFN